MKGRNMNKELVESLKAALAAAEGDKEVQHRVSNIQGEVLKYLKENGPSTCPQVTKGTGLKYSSVVNAFTILVKKNKVKFTRTSPRVYSVKASKEASTSKSGEFENWNDAVLDYVSKHNGERYSVGSVGVALGMTPGTIYTVVYRLQKRGLLAKDFNLGLATESTAKPAATDGQTEETSSEELTFQKVEFLVWNYVKETRNTDLLNFLTWLETKTK